MTDAAPVVVTGAFGYSGRYVAQRLIEAEVPVRTLTNSPSREHPFGDRIEVRPLAFDRPDELTHSLEGARALINTYWVRFNHRDFTYAAAVDNTLRLFAAAERASVPRVVHVSITNPSEDSPYEYFRGKARLERALAESTLAHTILRPAVLFGGVDILVNNIAWALRRLPVFGVFGDGSYRLQPIHVDDLARLAIRELDASSNRTVDAIGPETFTYRQLAETIGGIIGRRRPVVGVPPWFGFATGWLLGRLLGDVVITRDEIGALMDGLLCTDSGPTGSTKLSEWARANADELGIRYASELARRKNRALAYDRL